MKKKYIHQLKRCGLFLMVCVFSSPVFSQISYTFHPCGATGMNGPSQVQVTNAYLSTNLNGSVTVTGGIQSFTVPFTGNYRIEAYGAAGGNSSGYAGGLGAVMIGDFSLTSGTVLKIIAGQAGIAGLALFNGDVQQSGGTGGGGSFVVTSGNTPLIVAGGGGGASQAGTGGGFNATGQGGTVTINGVAGGGAPTSGGVSGGGGLTYNWTGWHGGTGGGGFSGNGINNSAGSTAYGTVNGPGIAFLNGGAGGTAGSSGRNGGFGGGGSSGFTGAGGGGYSGGGAGVTTGPPLGGGGGGSYNGGTSQNNTNAINPGDGKVIITALCNITLNTLGSNPICSGSSATITTNAISNYNWSTGANTSSIIVSPTVTTIYTLSATSPSNCTAGSAITIVVNNTPTVSAVTTTSVLCSGKTVVMTASGANTYTWTGGVTNAAVYTPTATQNYTVTGTNACGTSSAVTSVTVLPLPGITASVNNPTVCNGSTIILNGGGSVSGYTWNPSAPDNSPFVPPATVVYTVTGVGANGCTNTAVASITVLVTPTIVPVATPTAICVGATATLSAVGATGYTWTPGTNPNTSTVAVSPPAPTTYTLFRTNGACSSTTTVSLMVNPLPLVAASASPSQICTGTGINLVVVGPITNTWLPGGFTQANFTIFPNFSNTYTVTGSNGNCTATAVVPIVVNPTPTISILSSTNTICQGNNATLTVGGTGLISHTWMPSGNMNNPNETVSPGASTIITVSGTNSFGCTAMQQQLILVNPVPNMSLNSSIPYVCAGNSAVLSVVNPSNNVVYVWSSGPTGPSIPANPAVTTTYIATGTNTQTGCQNSNSIVLPVYISTLTVSSPSAICKGETATLTASGPSTSYLWSVNNLTAPSITVSPVINTNYVVTGFNGSCSSTLSIPLIVNPIPNVVASVAKPTICRFEISTIIGGGANTYSWNTGANTQTLSFNLSVTTGYTLTGTDLNNCSKTVTVTQYVATCIGVEEENGLENTGLEIFPNPSNGNFTMRANTNIEVKIVNTLGQVVGTFELNNGHQTEINIGGLNPGVYYVTSHNKGLKLNRKIVIER